MAPTSQRFLDSVTADVARIAALLDTEDVLDLPVPHCPGWRVPDVVAHLGGVHQMVVGAVRDGDPRSRGPQPPQEPRALSDWLLDGARDLVDVLSVDPETAAWSFDPDGGHVGFWQRRQAYETLIHRCDVEQALGEHTHLDPDLAADGVGEVLDVLVRLRLSEGTLELPPGQVTLLASDTGERWTLGSGPEVGTATATAGVLLLTLWKRAPLESLQTDSDAARAALGARLTP